MFHSVPFVLFRSIPFRLVMCIKHQCNKQLQEPVCFENHVNLTTGGTYALVDWLGEEAYSVVQCTKIGYMGVFTVGEVAKVWTSTGTFEAVIIASGKKLASKKKSPSVKSGSKLYHFGNSRWPGNKHPFKPKSQWILPKANKMLED